MGGSPPRATFNAHLPGERHDGVDTIAWAAAQPWSAGVVGRLRRLVPRLHPVAAAREQPPALRAMAPAVTSSDMYEGMAYQGGANVLHDLRWVVAASFPTRSGVAWRAARQRRRVAADLDLDAVSGPPAARQTIPCSGSWRPSTSTGWRIPTADAYWQPISPTRWLRADHCPGAQHRRLVRHLPVEHAPELPGHAAAGRHGRTRAATSA